jgi:hypothetical protein
MKNHEFYIKYKTNYQQGTYPIFSKKNWWSMLLITVAAVLIEPLLFMSKYQRSVPFTMNYYVQLIEYFLLVAVPFVAFLVWVNLQERKKLKRGYGWEGKFEVISKTSTFAFCYLFLSPGIDNKLKVDRDLFEKTRVGDFILIRRDALGGIEEVSKVKSFSSRLTVAGARRFPKSGAVSKKNGNS